MAEEAKTLIVFAREGTTGDPSVAVAESFDDVWDAFATPHPMAQDQRWPLLTRPDGSHFAVNPARVEQITPVAPSPQSRTGGDG